MNAFHKEMVAGAGESRGNSAINIGNIRNSLSPYKNGVTGEKTLGYYLNAPKSNVRLNKRKEIGKQIEKIEKLLHHKYPRNMHLGTFLKNIIYVKGKLANMSKINTEFANEPNLHNQTLAYYLKANAPNNSK